MHLFASRVPLLPGLSHRGSLEPRRLRPRPLRGSLERWRSLARLIRGSLVRGRARVNELQGTSSAQRTNIQDPPRPRTQHQRIKLNIQGLSRFNALRHLARSSVIYKVQEPRPNIHFHDRRSRVQNSMPKIQEPRSKFGNSRSKALGRIAKI